MFASEWEESDAERDQRQLRAALVRLGLALSALSLCAQCGAYYAGREHGREEVLSDDTEDRAAPMCVPRLRRVDVRREHQPEPTSYPSYYCDGCRTERV